MKKFFTPVIVAPTQAEDLGVELEDISATEFNSPLEKFYAALPEAKGDCTKF